MDVALDVPLVAMSAGVMAGVWAEMLVVVKAWTMVLKWVAMSVVCWAAM